jgi:hypothetical protein
VTLEATRVHGSLQPNARAIATASSQTSHPIMAM